MHRGSASGPTARGWDFSPPETLRCPHPSEANTWIRPCPEGWKAALTYRLSGNVTAIPGLARSRTGVWRYPYHKSDALLGLPPHQHTTEPPIKKGQWMYAIMRCVPCFRSVVARHRLVAYELPPKFAVDATGRGGVGAGRGLICAGRGQPRRGAVETLAQPAVSALDQQPDVSQQVFGADAELAEFDEVEFESVRRRGVEGRGGTQRSGDGVLGNQQLEYGRYYKSNPTS